MTVIRLQIDGAALSGQLRGVGRQRMVSLQRRIANQARADVPVATGNLGRSIGEGVVRFVGDSKIVGTVFAAAPYAAAVHEGRRGRVIVPVRARALRFTVGGRVVFAQRVVQGPTTPRPFLRNAAQRIAAQER